MRGGIGGGRLGALGIGGGRLARWGALRPRFGERFAQGCFQSLRHIGEALIRRGHRFGGGRSNRWRGRRRRRRERSTKRRRRPARFRAGWLLARQLLARQLLVRRFQLRFLWLRFGVLFRRDASGVGRRRPVGAAEAAGERTVRRRVRPAYRAAGAPVARRATTRDAAIRGVAIRGVTVPAVALHPAVARSAARAAHRHLRLQRPSGTVAVAGVRQRYGARQRFDAGGRPRGVARRRDRAHDIGFDHDVGRAADHQQMLDIVAPD